MNLKIVSLVLCALGASRGEAFAKSSIVAVPMNEVRAYSGDRGAFYVISLSIPQDVFGNRLDSVFLEFAVEATPLVEDSVTVTPLVGAYPLLTEYAGGVVGDGQGRNPEPVFQSIVPSSRPVAAGDNRAVKMDITDVVREWIANPLTNHGLVIGSLIGPEIARVTLKNSIQGGETPIRITFFYQNRFGDRISARHQ